MQGASRRGVPEWLIASCGVWQIGLALYFIFLRPALLPEDVRYMGSTFTRCKLRFRGSSSGLERSSQ